MLLYSIEKQKSGKTEPPIALNTAVTANSKDRPWPCVSYTWQFPRARDVSRSVGTDPLAQPRKVTVNFSLDPRVWLPRWRLSDDAKFCNASQYPLQTTPPPFH